VSSSSQAILRTATGSATSLRVRTLAVNALDNRILESQMKPGQEANSSFSSTINGDDIVSQSPSEQTIGTYNVNTIIKKDIEDEEYIYKVKCAPRDTISLRDSRPVQYDHVAAKKLSKTSDTKDIQLTDLKSTAVSSNEESLPHVTSTHLRTLTTKEFEATDSPDRRRSTFTKKNLAIDIPKDEFQQKQEKKESIYENNPLIEVYEKSMKSQQVAAT